MRMIDLDRFKEVCDTQSHAGGDALLAQPARRLRVGVRESDLVTRIGGGEFVLLPGLDSAADEPINHADQAIRQAKACGRKQLHRLTPALHEPAQRQARLDKDLRSAIERGEMKRVYQPIVETTGLAGELGDWVLLTATRQVRQWLQHLDPDFRISTNQPPP